jgi:hypothetical protein
MRTIQPARTHAARGPLAGLLAGALVLLLAACGSSAATSAPATAPATQVPATAPAASADAGGGGGGDTGTADCAAVKEAATTISLELTLLMQADSAAQWKAMTAADAPVVLSGDRLAAAVDVLGKAAGAGDLAAKYRAIAALEQAAVASGDPWGGGTGPGAEAQKKVAAEYVDLGVALGTLLDSLGC